MRILLDTHLLLWSLAEQEKLSATTRNRLDAAEVFVSAASVWEVSSKVGLGKLAVDPPELLAAIEPAGFELLPITGLHAAAVAALPRLHRDPFDRLLVAQARTEPLILLTNDAVLQQYGPGIELIR